MKSGPDWKKWEHITFAELLHMPQTELNTLLSYCWREVFGEIRPRCETIGIENLRMERMDDVCKRIGWEDKNGGDGYSLPGHPRDYKLSEHVHQITYDGEWFYGLYKPKI